MDLGRPAGQLAGPWILAGRSWTMDLGRPAGRPAGPWFLAGRPAGWLADREIAGRDKLAMQNCATRAKLWTGDVGVKSLFCVS